MRISFLVCTRRMRADRQLAEERKCSVVERLRIDYIDKEEAIGRAILACSHKHTFSSLELNADAILSRPCFYYTRYREIFYFVAL